jgi:hypothetical protein
MQIDNPRTRRGWTCPLCFGPKDAGLVVCWPCFKGPNGLKYNHEREAEVSAFEAFLESQERRT